MDNRYTECVSLKEWWGMLSVKLTGSYGYRETTGNMGAAHAFCKDALRLALGWVYWRSKKKSFNWDS